MAVPTDYTTSLGGGGDPTLDRIDPAIAFIDPGIDKCTITLHLLTGDHIVRPQPTTREN